VKGVPAGAIVVGVAAHEVGSKPKATPKEHFDAYGTPQDAAADPVFAAMQKMQDELEILRRRVTELEADDASLLGSARKWEPK
jgi:hypothetical protein